MLLSVAAVEGVVAAQTMFTAAPAQNIVDVDGDALIAAKRLVHGYLKDCLVGVVALLVTSLFLGRED